MSGSLTLMCTCDVSFVRVSGVFHKAYDDASSSVPNRTYSEVSLGDTAVSYIHEVGRHLGMNFEFVFRQFILSSVNMYYKFI